MRKNHQRPYELLVTTDTSQDFTYNYNHERGASRAPNTQIIQNKMVNNVSVYYRLPDTCCQLWTNMK